MGQTRYKVTTPLKKNSRNHLSQDKLHYVQRLPTLGHTLLSTMKEEVTSALINKQM